MILSLSRSSSLKITRDDWLRAEILYDSQAQHLPRLLECASITDDQKTLNESIVRFVSGGSYTRDEVERYLATRGLDFSRIKINIDGLIGCKTLGLVDGRLIVVNGVIVNDEGEAIEIRDGVNVKAEALPAQLTH
jgi:hypothetical protein